MELILSLKNIRTVSLTKVSEKNIITVCYEDGYLKEMFCYDDNKAKKVFENLKTLLCFKDEIPQYTVIYL